METRIIISFLDRDLQIRSQVSITLNLEFKFPIVRRSDLKINHTEFGIQVPNWTYSSLGYGTDFKLVIYLDLFFGTLELYLPQKLLRHVS